VEDQDYHDQYVSDTGPFSIVPEWVTTSEVSSGAVRLYALLARYADYATGEAWPSRATLAVRLRMSTDSIDRFSKELQALGAIEVVRRFDGKKWRSNLYVVKRVPPAGLESGRTSTATDGRRDTATHSRKDAERTRAIEPEPVEGEKTSDLVQRVFNEWIESTGKDAKRTRLDQKRATRIKWALKHYELDDVLDAVKGWKCSPFHAGQNPTAKTYNDLTLVLRNSDRLEYFRDCYRSPQTNEGQVPATWHRLKEMMGDDDE